MKTLLAAKCRICNQQLGLHQQDTLKCPAYRDGFPAGYGDTVYEPKFFTASDIALAEEKGRREAEAKFWPIFMWLLGYTDFPERKPGEGAYHWRGKLRRDLENTITDFDALLAEGKKEASDDGPKAEID